MNISEMKRKLKDVPFNLNSILDEIRSGSGGSVNIPIAKTTVSTTDWVLNDNLYEYTFTHNLGQDLTSIVMYKSDTKESVDFSYELSNDKNSVKLITSLNISADIIVTGSVSPTEGGSSTASKITIADTDNLFTATNVEDALKEVFQSGVSVKNEMVQAINSKNTVPNITNNASWAEIKQSVADIKEAAGDALVSDVLVGKTFTNNEGRLLTGTMVNRGGAQTIIPSVDNRVLGNGYYSGDITVQGDPNLKPENIKQGVSIFNINGKLNSGHFESGEARISADTADFTMLPSLSQFRYKYIKINLDFTPKVIFIETVNDGYYINMECNFITKRCFSGYTELSSGKQQVSVIDNNIDLGNNQYRIPMYPLNYNGTFSWIAVG